MAVQRDKPVPFILKPKSSEEGLTGPLGPAKHVVQALVVPTVPKEREGWGTHSGGAKGGAPAHPTSSGGQRVGPAHLRQVTIRKNREP